MKRDVAPSPRPHAPSPPQVSARAVLWNFAGALVLQLSAMVFIPAVVTVAAGAWTGVYGEDGQFVQACRYFSTAVALSERELAGREDSPGGVCT